MICTPGRLRRRSQGAAGRRQGPAVPWHKGTHTHLKQSFQKRLIHCLIFLVFSWICLFHHSSLVLGISSTSQDRGNQINHIKFASLLVGTHTCGGHQDQKSCVFGPQSCFAVGWGANNDPIRGYGIVFVIAVVCVAIGDLNQGQNSTQIKSFSQ